MVGYRRLPAFAGQTGVAGRTAWVDVAKGLCIALVVMMHATLGVGEAMGGEGWLHPLVAFARPFRIPAFFLLAGLFLARTIQRPWHEYADRKLLHFFYFYLVWAAIQIALKYGMTAGFPAAANQFALALVEPFGTLWFIYLLPIFFAVTKILQRMPAMPMLLTAAFLEMLHIQTGWQVIDEFCARYVWFFAGYCFAAHIFDWAEMAREEKTNTAAFISGFTILNAFLVAKMQADLPVTSLFLGALGAMALIAVAALLVPTRPGRILATAGSHSLIIYLAFFLPMTLVRFALLHTGAAVHIGIGTTSLLVWLAAVSAPFLLHSVFRTTPLRYLFERPAWARWPRPRRNTVQPAE